MTLFATMNADTGKVISLCQQRHRHQECLKFLRSIAVATTAECQIYLIADNFSTHKHARVRQGLKRHPRFHEHFPHPVPRGSAWSKTSFGM